MAKNTTTYECWDCGDEVPEAQVSAYYDVETNELGFDENDPEYGQQFYRCVRCG